MLLRADLDKSVKNAYRYDMFSALFGGIFAGAFYPFLYRILRNDLRASSFFIGLLMAAPFLGPLVTPLFTRYSKGNSRMSFLVWTSAAGRLLALSMLFIVRPFWFVAVIFLSYVLTNISLPAYSSIMKEVYPDELRGRIMGYIRIMIQLASFGAALFVGIMLDKQPSLHLPWINKSSVDIVINYRYILPAFGIFGLFSSLAFGKIKVSTNEQGESKADSLITLGKILKSDKNFTYVTIAIFIFGFGNLILSPVYALYQVDILHITNFQIALLANVTIIASVFSYIIWGNIIDKKSPMHSYLLAFFITALTPAIYYLSEGVNHLLFAALATGIGNAGLDMSFLNISYKFASDEMVPHYQAIQQMSMGIRGLIAPFIGVVLIESIGHKNTFLIGLVIILMGCCLQYICMKRIAAAPPINTSS